MATAFSTKRRATSHGTVLTTFSILTIVLCCGSFSCSPVESLPEEDGTPAADATEDDSANAGDGTPSQSTGDSETGTDGGDAGDETPTEPAELAEVSEDRTIAENITVVGDLVRSVSAKYPGERLPLNDPRWETEPLLLRLSRQRDRLIELYDRNLEPADHYELCLALSRLPLPFRDATIDHCRRYLDHEAAEPSSDEYQAALATVADTYFKTSRFEEAEEAYREFLRIACDFDKETAERRLAASCRAVVTQRLPQIYHELGKVDELARLIDMCWAYGFDRPSDLLQARTYLLQDYWLKEDLEPLERLTDECLASVSWSDKRTSVGQRRVLLAAALSARARLRLLEKNCFAGRKVYLDYDFDHPGADRAWLRDNVLGPGRLLCRPAPALDVTSWLGGSQPDTRPGAPAGDRLILVAFIDVSIPGASGFLTKLDNFATRQAELVQLLGVIVPRDRVYNPTDNQMAKGLSPEGFTDAVENLANDLEVPYPWAVAQHGDKDPQGVFQRYRVHRFPTIVLIDKSGTVVAYHSLATLGPGWDRLVEALAAR